jgi:excisionase family DNA binding protein
MAGDYGLKEDAKEQERLTPSADPLRDAIAGALVDVLPLLVERIADHPPRRWLPPDEAAAYLCVSRSRLFEMVREGVLPCHKYRKKTVFDIRELDTFWRKRKYKEDARDEWA